MTQLNVSQRKTIFKALMRISPEEAKSPLELARAVWPLPQVAADLYEERKAAYVAVDRPMAADAALRSVMLDIHKMRVSRLRARNAWRVSLN